MNKRDLKADLGIARGMKPLNTSEYYEGISLETAQQYMMAAEGWPHAIERAIEAEALVRELVTTLEGAVFWLKGAGYSVEDYLFMASKAKEVLGE